MTTSKTIVLTLLALMLVLTGGVFAQESATADVNPNANISWPPPVYVLRGEFTLRGSANLATMTTYFIEFRPLADDLSIPDEDAPWIPAVLPNASAIQDDVLGVWNTATAPDGLYEVRLVVNIRDGDPEIFRVSPLRVENNPPPFAAVFLTPTPQTLPPTPTQQPIIATPTSTPTIAPTFDPTPRVTPQGVNANVRFGDGTNYGIVGGLTVGQEARVLGVSNTGSGWYLIALPNGRRGWIAPFVVDTLGDFNNLPFVAPPPPPTPTPIPATPTPITSANLVISNMRLFPEAPRCNETFTVFITISNNGTGPTSSGGIVSVADTHVASGVTVESTVGGFPILQPGQVFEVSAPITVNAFFEEAHRLLLVADVNGEIPETNEGDNVATRDYVLQRAACG